ncbi:hypothetical protein J1M35_14660 [Ottowia testudinis]|uniref:Uncharacterized protein n=2 Tax=Ottowia testudinis TaxID=2816950 RepID=A0A975H4W6_9BURK|nr:hypothetical protein [Ottowia testudinis]QTD44342.1 hypothetical protein J1M35_14660 [Ottowia testudinis]
MAERKNTLAPRDWWSKSAAGLLLGLGLALGCSGLFHLAATEMAPSIRAQLTMWTVMPIWLGVLALVFLFRSGKRAWLGLGAANVLVIGTWAALKFL